MEFNHTSVMYNEVMNYLNVDTEGVYVDGTLGGGGHASGIGEMLAQKGCLIGIDRDIDAICAAKENLKKLECNKIYIQDNYSNIKSVLAELDIKGINGAILDLGVSSFQLDNWERGFSYMQVAPLDMRMNQTDTVTAEEIINTYSKEELSRVIKGYGEERWAARIAEFIVRERKKSPVKTTEDLVNIIKAAIPASARREGPHPAKRTFQAIRIEVNDEIGQLEHAVNEFCDVLLPGGRLCIITFHSLEDRIVKNVFQKRSNPCECPPSFPICVCGKEADIVKVTKKPLIPTEQEIKLNPRARSAKMRVVEKI